MVPICVVTTCDEAGGPGFSEWVSEVTGVAGMRSLGLVKPKGSQQQVSQSVELAAGADLY